MDINSVLCAVLGSIAIHAHEVTATNLREAPAVLADVKARNIGVVEMAPIACKGNGWVLPVGNANMYIIADKAVAYAMLDHSAPSNALALLGDYLGCGFATVDDQRAVKMTAQKTQKLISLWRRGRKCPASNISRVLAGDTSVFVA